MNFIRSHLQFILGHGGYKLLEKEVTRIQDKDILSTLPELLHPGCSLGETAKAILLPSGGAGLDLPIDIVTINEEEGLCSVLGRS